MRFNRIHLVNFMSYEDCTLNLSDVSACSVIGPNGAGKSSIIEAVLWGLFGHAKLPNKDLIRSGQKTIKVELEFELNGKRYSISREINAKGMHVDLLVDGASIAQGTNLQTAALAKHLGTSRDLLLQSIAVTQGQLSAFVSSVPSERRDLILSMLSLDRYTTAWTAAKDNVQALQSMVQAHDKMVESLQDQAKKIPPDEDIDKCMQELQQKLDSTSQEVESKSARKEVLIAQDKDARERLTELEANTGKLKIKIAKTTLDLDRDVEAAKDIINKVDKEVSLLPTVCQAATRLEQELKEVEEAKSRLRELRVQETQCSDEMNRYQEKIVVASRGTNNCPLCGSEIGEERWRSILAAMKNELNALVARKTQLGHDVQATQTAKTTESVKRQLEEAKAKITRTTTKQESRSGLVEQLESLMKKREQMLEELSQQLTHIEEDIKGTQGKLSTEVGVIDGQLKVLKQEQRKTSDSLMEWAALKKSRETIGVSLTEAAEHLEMARTKLPETEFVVQALSPTGIPLMIIDHYLPLIELRAQSLLGQMSDGKLSLKMSVIETGNKKGIEIHAGTDYLRPVKALSGGEQTRVSLAIRLALSQMLAEMAGCRFDCLIIDEPEWLDDNGVDMFVQSINKLCSVFSQFFVISHVKGIQMAFPNTILVEKVDGVSRATVL